jgi:hypothetical protein
MHDLTAPVKFYPREFGSARSSTILSIDNRSFKQTVVERYMPNSDEMTSFHNTDTTTE